MLEDYLAHNDFMMMMNCEIDTLRTDMSGYGGLGHIVAGIYTYLIGPTLVRSR